MAEHDGRLGLGGVAAVDPADAGRVEVLVSVRGANRIGDHVTGTVTLTLPKEAS